MAHVFISHSHEDADFVTGHLKTQINQAGFEAWIDSERLLAGEDWRNEIDRAIREAFAVVAVMSPPAFESKYVTYEWAFAVGIGVKVIPIMLKSTKLHPRLEVLQYLNFTERTARPWNVLIQRLQTIYQIHSMPLPGFGTNPSPPTSPAPSVQASWKNQHENEQHGTYDVSQMLNTLEDNDVDEDERIKAAELLATFSSIAKQDVVPGLLAALHDTDSSTVRGAAANALGIIGDQRAIRGLTLLLSDTSYTNISSGGYRITVAYLAKQAIERIQQTNANN